jgi:hypothetical protein
MLKLLLKVRVRTIYPYLFYLTRHTEIRTFVYARHEDGTMCCNMLRDFALPKENENLFLNLIYSIPVH